MNSDQDDLQHLYEEANEIDAVKPSPAVRAAVLAHAAMRAQSRTGGVTDTRPMPRVSANWPNWKSGLVASVLLLPLVGILVMRVSQTPQVHEQVTSMAQASLPLPAQPTAEGAPATRAVPQPGVHAAMPPAAPAAKAAPATPAVAAMPAMPAIPATGSAMATVDTPPDVVANAVANAVANTAAAPAAKVLADRAEAPALAGRSREAAKPEAAGLQAEILEAAREGNAQRVQILLNAGASVNSRDALGRTPLIWAVLGGHEVLVRRLIEAGADKGIVDRDGLTALQCARRLGYTAIASLLE